MIFGVKMLSYNQLPKQFELTFVRHENHNFFIQNLPQSHMNSALILRRLCREPTRITDEFAWEYLHFSREFPLSLIKRKQKKK